MVSTIIDRPADLTPRICRRCHSRIDGAARMLSDRGVVEYEHVHDCPERAWPVNSWTGEATEVEVTK